MPDKRILSEEGIEQRRRENARDRKRESRAKAEGFSTYEKQQQARVVDPDEARQILAEKWGVQHPHIFGTIYELGVSAAEASKVGATAAYWSRGPAGRGPEQQSENEVSGECWASRAELFSLWQFSMAWEQNTPAPTFEEFLNLRLKCKTDATYLGEVLGMDLHPQPHTRWSDLLCHFEPTLLRPGYDQEQMKRAFASISETRIKMLIAARNSYKSSFALRVFLTQAILFCPDVRVLIVSETKPLSKKMAVGLKKMMTAGNLHNRTTFQKLFPEILTQESEGEQLVWNNPMAHLDLLAPTCESTSMDSTVAGNRADILLFDDPISNMSCGTEEQRKKSVEKFDALTELLEVGGQIVICGTPWSGEGEGDLYAQLLARNERSHSMAVVIDPCWETRPEARHKSLWDLEESDVVLMFPARLTWAVLQKKLREGDPLARTFRQQSLCMWIPDVEESAKLNFDRETILKFVVKPPVLGDGDVRATMDIGFSKTKYADPSSITLSKVEKRDLLVLEQSTGHWRTTEKAEEIVRLHRKYDVKLWVIENFAGREDLEDAIHREMLKYGLTHFPLHWLPTEAHAGAEIKWKRIKSLEAPLHNGRVRLVEGAWNIELLDELEWLDEKKIGYRAGGNHHDDRADSLSMAVKLFLPRGEGESSSAAVDELEKKQEEARRRQETYDMIFSGSSKWSQGVPRLSDKDPDPGYQVQRGPFGIPGLRGFPQQPSDPDKKPRTFSDLLPKNN